MKRLLLGLVFLMGSSHTADAKPKTAVNDPRAALIETLRKVPGFKESKDMVTPLYLGRTPRNMYFAKDDSFIAYKVTGCAR